MYALQAITTKYLAPTNTRGARVKATAACGSITVPWDHALDACQNHHTAACALARSKDWADELGMAIRPHAFGALPDGCYVMAFITK